MFKHTSKWVYWITFNAIGGGFLWVGAFERQPWAINALWVYSILSLFAGGFTFAASRNTGALKALKAQKAGRTIPKFISIYFGCIFISGAVASGLVGLALVLSVAWVLEDIGLDTIEQEVNHA